MCIPELLPRPELRGSTKAREAVGLVIGEHPCIRERHDRADTASDGRHPDAERSTFADSSYLLSQAPMLYERTA